MLRRFVRCLTLALCLAVVSVVLGRPAGLAAGPTSIEDCQGVPEGGPCKVTADPVPGDCREPLCFENECMANSPSQSAVPCTDTDGNPCTRAACVPGAAVCNQAALAPNGSTCPDTDGNPCTVARCQNGSCSQTSLVLADQTACPDIDGNPCTVAGCLGGSCSQTAFPLPDFSACPDLDSNPCSLPQCLAGTCLQSAALAPNGTSCAMGTPPVPFCPGPICTGGSCGFGGGGATTPAMDNLAAVEVEARLARVTEWEAYNDCCAVCEPQSLEALIPTPDGPERLEPNGCLPPRTTFCGTVVRYGIKDEQNDPRDIMLNMVPSPGFDHFLAGFLNTECTPLSASQKNSFCKSDSQCPVAACLAAISGQPGRCIHAELTPANQFFGQDASFLPIRSSGVCGDSWNCNSALEPAKDWSGSPPPGGQTGQQGREACVYGVYAVDHGKEHRPYSHRQLCCSPDPSHDRPEIHPFDAVWFLHPNAQPGWIFGVFQDDSNRYSFPHCGDENNGNQWSEAPRDLTFRFPFQFARVETPLRACLRHTRTTDFNGNLHEVLPLNVTTAVMPVPLTEQKTLQDGGLTLLEVVEPPGAEGETQVRIDGCFDADEIKGYITVRVAVGCPAHVSCPALGDDGDPGSGFYYGELIFQEDCSR